MRQADVPEDALQQQEIREQMARARAEAARQVRMARAYAGGMSQGELTRLTGLNRQAISEIELGRRNLAFEEMVGIAKATGYPLERFVEATRVSLRGRPSRSPDLIVLPGNGGDTVSAVQSPTVSIVRPPPVRVP